MKIDKFLKKIIKYHSNKDEIFNVLKFREQLSQSIYYLDEVCNRLLLKNKKKLNVLDLCAGVGTYALYVGYKYRKNINRIYATEINPDAYHLLKKNIEVNNLKNIITPCLVENDDEDNPYNFKKNLSSRIKFDLIISNPPYVPMPKEFSYYKWGAAGDYGISVIYNILNFFPKYLSNRGVLFLLTYSLGLKNPEKGSLISGNLDKKIFECKNYLDLIKKLIKKWNFEYYLLKPGAWVGFDKKYKNTDSILLSEYYKLIFNRRLNKEIKKYIQKLAKNDCRYLHNIIMIGKKKKNKNNKNNKNNIKQYLIKNIDISYFKNVYKIEKKTWPKFLQASKNNLISRLNYFPQGCYGAFNINGELIGFATSQIVNIKLNKLNKQAIIKKEYWMKLDTEKDSIITETFCNNGNALHLVSACVIQEHRNNGIWKGLINARIQLAKTLSLKYVVILSRINVKEKINNFNKLIKYIKQGEDMYLNTLYTYKFKFLCLIEKTDDIKSNGYWVLLYRKLYYD